MVEQVTVNLETDQGPTLEEEAAAMDAAQETPTEEVPPVEETTDRPDWLPEKFSSVEDMAKAYSELEKKMSSPEPEKVEATEEAEKAVSDAGLNFEAFTNEFSENGTLSDASYQQLADKGIPREVVDGYIQGQVAQAEAARESVMAEAGGEEAYDTMIGWAADNFAEAEIDAFNDVVASNNPEQIKMAIRGLKARYDASNGSEPSRNLSGSIKGDGGSSYESVNQLMADMQNPKYAEDPAFRAQVERKLANSDIM